VGSREAAESDKRKKTIGWIIAFTCQGLLTWHLGVDSDLDAVAAVQPSS